MQSFMVLLQGIVNFACVRVGNKMKRGTKSGGERRMEGKAEVRTSASKLRNRQTVLLFSVGSRTVRQGSRDLPPRPR